MIYWPMDVRQRIGWNLRRLRKEREISQEDFATDSGFDRGYISGVERGVRNPSVLVLERIAVALGVDVAELLDAQLATRFAASAIRLC
ncbi:helix-turn-helix domain-containing protein [Sphingopyxis macrogoltabida]|nr:helix-turn-helix transcriptional regulator [Sphingopyxis macrogoltabida]